MTWSRGEPGQDDGMTLGGMTAIQKENVLPLGSQFLGNGLQLKIHPGHSTLGGFLSHHAIVLSLMNPL